MQQVTIRHADGHITVENILTEVDSVLTYDERLEYTIWSDGALSIDGLVGDTFEDDQVRLDLAAVRKLRDFLNSQRITDMLANR